jgi:hypothetical protein
LSISQADATTATATATAAAATTATILPAAVNFILSWLNEARDSDGGSQR